MQPLRFFRALLLAIVAAALPGQAQPKETTLYEAELIFPPEHWHNHASCIVECPNGDLLVCWYNGSGERSADDVKVEGARRRKGNRDWSPRFVLADTPGFPDTNPCMMIDPQSRLWLFWQTIVANQWHTALAKYKISSSYLGDGPPKWDLSDTLLFKPGPEFAREVERQTALDESALDKFPAAQRERVRGYLAQRRKNAADKYFSRMGWMTRAHPLVLDGRRLIVPLYSDGFSFSIMAITDDWGRTWTASTPLVGAGNIQPSLVRKRDGTLVAYMRDNGPPPKRLMVSQSKDRGQTWSPVTDSDLPNPGSGAEVLGLKNGDWVLIYNDTERGRHSLAVSLSDDEGRTWKWTRHLERSDPGPSATHAAYPSIIEAKDGTLHASYTYTLNGKNVKKDASGRPARECIKHAHFNVAWIKLDHGPQELQHGSAGAQHPLSRWRKPKSRWRGGQQSPQGLQHSWPQHLHLSARSLSRIGCRHGASHGHALQHCTHGEQQVVGQQGVLQQGELQHEVQHGDE